MERDFKYAQKVSMHIRNAQYSRVVLSCNALNGCKTLKKEVDGSRMVETCLFDLLIELN